MNINYGKGHDKIKFPREFRHPSTSSLSTFCVEIPRLAISLVVSITFPSCADFQLWINLKSSMSFISFTLLQLGIFSSHPISFVFHGIEKIAIYRDLTGNRREFWTGNESSIQPKIICFSTHSTLFTLCCSFDNFLMSKRKTIFSHEMK